jgi:hypothetical protein
VWVFGQTSSPAVGVIPEPMLAKSAAMPTRAGYAYEPKMDVALARREIEGERLEGAPSRPASLTLPSQVA